MGKSKFKGTFAQRFFIFLMSIVLGVLLFWLMDFVTDDIGSLPGPNRAAIESKYIESGLVSNQRNLKENLEDVQRRSNNKQQQGNILSDSTNNLQKTIKQLLDIQRQSIEKNVNFSVEKGQILAESQKLFLKNQQQYQTLNREIGQLTQQQHNLQSELAAIDKELEKQRNLGQREYHKLLRKHRFKVAVLKLAVLIPLFVVATWFFIKKRSGTYGVIAYSAFIAVFLKISLVIHEHFPTKYFKYIALLVVTGVIVKLLVYFLKRIVFPQKDWLIKQYQQAYDKYLCPICGKPIRIGPLRYITRKKHLTTPAQSDQQQPYACPSCGSQLYEKCDKCSDIRHSLLPFCEHCGNEKN